MEGRHRGEEGRIEEDVVDWRERRRKKRVKKREKK